MEFTRRLNALLMNLWGRKCFPRPTPPPSWRLPPRKVAYKQQNLFITALESGSPRSSHQKCLCVVRAHSLVHIRCLLAVTSQGRGDEGPLWGCSFIRALRHNGPEFEQTPGDGEGQGGLACCSPRGCKESDMTEQQQYAIHEGSTPL